jgi:hypothetical protein
VVNRRFDDEAARPILTDIDRQEAAEVSRARTTESPTAPAE